MRSNEHSQEHMVKPEGLEATDMSTVRQTQHSALRRKTPAALAGEVGPVQRSELAERALESSIKEERERVRLHWESETAMRKKERAENEDRGSSQ